MPQSVFLLGFLSIYFSIESLERKRVAFGLILTSCKSCEILAIGLMCRSCLGLRAWFGGFEMLFASVYSWISVVVLCLLDACEGAIGSGISLNAVQSCLKIWQKSSGLFGFFCWVFAPS